MENLFWRISEKCLLVPKTVTHPISGRTVKRRGQNERGFFHENEVLKKGSWITNQVVKPRQASKVWFGWTGEVIGRWGRASREKRNRLVHKGSNRVTFKGFEEIAWVVNTGLHQKSLEREKWSNALKKKWFRKVKFSIILARL